MAQTKKKFPTYPKYKYLFPENPTEEDFRLAWKSIFDYYPEDCNVKYCDDYIGELYGRNLKNSGFWVRTPDGKLHMDGGFGEHTEEPVLEDNQNFYYSGIGCDWDEDMNGKRFYLIDKETNLPHDFLYVYSRGIINNYLNAQVNVLKKYIM